MPERTRKGEVFLALFLFSTLYFFSLFKIKSYDIWWHIKAGEKILSAGFRPLALNTFSWTEPDFIWTNFSWLFDAVVYSIHKTYGFPGLVLIQAFIVTGIFYLVYKTIMTRSSSGNNDPPVRWSWLIALIFIGYFAARFRFSIRPHLLALFFFSLYLYLLNLYRYEGKKWLFIIPLVQIVWANSHASAILGIVLPSLFAFGAWIDGSAIKSNLEGNSDKTECRTISFLAGITLIVSFVNPYGYEILTEPLSPLLGNAADTFSTLTVHEWQRPGMDLIAGWYGIFLFIGLASFYLVYRRRGENNNRERRKSWTDLLLFTLFTLLSVKAVRFIDLFVVLAIPIIYENSVSFHGPYQGERENKPNRNYPKRLLPFFIILLFLQAGRLDRTYATGLSADDQYAPAQAVGFMKEHGIEGKIFNSYNFGGYLIYAGYPVFVDGRLNYSPGLLKDFAVANLTLKGWEKISKLYDFDIVLVDYDKPVIPTALLMDKENWALVYWDDLAMLFLRRSAKFAETINSREDKVLNPMAMNGMPPELSGSKESVGKIMDQVFEEAARGVDLRPDSKRAHMLLGNLKLNRGRPGEAMHHYKVIIESESDFWKAEAHNNRGVAYEKMGYRALASVEYAKAICYDSSYPLPLKNAGLIAYDSSRYDQALWFLDRYMAIDPDADLKIRSLMPEMRKYRTMLIFRIFVGGGALIGLLWILMRRCNPSPTGQG